MSSTPPGNNGPGDPRAPGDPVARDRFGRPILDRYGRPVPGRSSEPAPPPDGTTREYGGRHRQAEPPQYRRQQAAPQYPQQSRQPQHHDRRHQHPAPPPEPRPGSQPRQRRRRRRPRPLRIIGAVLLVLALIVGGTAWWVDSNLNRVDALSGYEGQIGNTSGANWLLVGNDSRAGISEEDGERYAAGDLTDAGARTDTIIVVHVPTFGGKPTMVSIPRDSYVNIPGYGENKVNAAYALGGPHLLQQTVEQATGLRMDHYMEIGFDGFGRIVDAVGGVELCPDEPINDPMAGLNVEAGCQEMDGPTSLGYVRTRYTSAQGDLDRVERQREFLSAVVSKVGSFGTLANPFRALPLINAFSDALTVDEGDRVWHLGRLGLGMVRGADQQTVPVGGFADTAAGSVVLWDDAAAEELFAGLR